jgi:hypothetical protein
MPRPRLLVLTAALGLALATGACSTQEDPTASVEASSSAEEQLLAEHGLEGLSAQEIVEELDRSPQPRPLSLGASVQADQLLLTDEDTEMTLALPDDVFYLSVAPYVSSTHDCYNHSLATCQGELAEEQIQVTITDDSGEVLVDEEVTTYTNGFAGFWLPRGTSGTVEVDHEGRSGTAGFSTDVGDPTCMTTLQLSA